MAPMRKYVANFSKGNSSPLRDTAPEDTAIAGAISPAMTARIAGPVVIVNCAPGYGPGWTLSLPSWISAWRTISLPTRISKLAEFLAAASGLKVERSAMTSDSGVTISSGCTSPSNWAPHRPRARTISSSPCPYSVSVYTTDLRGVSSSFRSITPASCNAVSLFVRIFVGIRGRPRFRSLKRWSLTSKSRMISRAHRSPTTSAARSNPQYCPSGHSLHWWPLNTRRKFHAQTYRRTLRLG